MIRHCRNISPMYTIAESEVFSRYVSDYWTEEERAAFAVWIAEHYDAGDIVRGSGGCRKVPWNQKVAVKEVVYV